MAAAGESEEQHRELVKFCQDFRFERCGFFSFSEQDGTPAADLPEQVTLLSISQYLAERELSLGLS